MLKGIDGIEFDHITARPVPYVSMMHRDHRTLARNVMLHMPHSRVGETSTMARAIKYSLTRA